MNGSGDHEARSAGKARAGNPASSRRPRAETVIEKIRSFISRLSPDAVCDDCIAERLGLSVRQHANHKSRELAGSGGFERRKDRCSLCGGDKLVIRLT